MQVMPATGRDMKTGDITRLEPNIHAGVKYIRHVQNTYFESQPMDPVNKTLFSFASYNAGRAGSRTCARAPRSAASNRTCGSTTVELIAAERIGAETVTYVSNIYKYYVAYKLAVEVRAGATRERDAREETVSEVHCHRAYGRPQSTRAPETFTTSVQRASSSRR